MLTAILRHELRLTFFNSKTWYCVAGLQILLGLTFHWLLNIFLRHQATATTLYGITEEVFHPYFAWLTLLNLAFVPIVTTQALCMERQKNTLVNYYCAPISATDVILGKYLSLNILLILMLGLASIIPLSIVISGNLDWGQFSAMCAGVYLLLSAALAIGLALSAFMLNIIRSNIAIFFVLACFVLLEWAAQYAGNYAMFLQNFGLLKPLKSFLSGIINLQFLTYYILIICSFLMLGIWLYLRRCNDAA